MGSGGGWGIFFMQKPETIFQRPFKLTWTVLTSLYCLYKYILRILNMAFEKRHCNILSMMIVYIQ
jgi:hypothetical protein